MPKNELFSIIRKTETRDVVKVTLTAQAVEHAIEAWAAKLAEEEDILHENCDIEIDWDVYSDMIRAVTVTYKREESTEREVTPGGADINQLFER